MNKLIITSLLGLCSTGLLLGQSSNGKERIEWSKSMSSEERADAMGPTWTSSNTSKTVAVNKAPETPEYDAFVGKVMTLDAYLHNNKDAADELTQLSDRQQPVLVVEESELLGLISTETVYLLTDHESVKGDTEALDSGELLAFEDSSVITMDHGARTESQVQHEGQFQIIGQLIEREGPDEIVVMQAFPVYSQLDG